MNKSILSIWITILFITTVLTPIGFGNKLNIPDDKIIVNKNDTLSYNNSVFSTVDQSTDNIYDNKSTSTLNKNCNGNNIFSNVFVEGPWPMYCHDVRHTGRSPYSTASNPGTVKWKFETEYGIDSSPTIDENGTIYIGSNEGYLFAFYPNGTEKWRFTTNFIVDSSPAIAEDGTIYVGSHDDYFYAVYPNGTLRWKFYTYDTVSSSPAIAEDGTVYFGVLGPGWDKGRIYALYPNGTEKWYFDTGFWVYTSPAIGMDGTVYCSSNDKYLCALDSDNGTLKWSFIRDDYLGSPAIADDGTIYIPCWDGYLYAIYQNGTIKWKSDIGWGSGHTPSIDKYGTIYIGGDELYAIYPNGTRKWAFNPGRFYDVTSVSHAISDDGIIYFGVSNDTGAGGYLIAVNLDGTEKWREWIHNERVWSSPAIGGDGTIYIGTSWNDFGVFYAIGELDPNAPDAPEINGPNKGKKEIEYQYTFKSTSPLGRELYYYIDWGNTITDWTGPYTSGQTITVNHTWNTKGSYIIQSRTKDTDNLWGPCSTFEVKISNTKILTNSLLLRFLERFPMLERLLFLSK